MRKTMILMAVAALMVALVDVTDGNRRARGHLGLQQFAVTDDYTEIEVNEEDAELAALAVGDEVKVQSRASKAATEFVARKISTETEVD